MLPFRLLGPISTYSSSCLLPSSDFLKDILILSISFIGTKYGWAHSMSVDKEEERFDSHGVMWYLGVEPALLRIEAIEEVRSGLKDSPGVASYTAPS